MRARVSEGSGFFAALDQSGGSTPSALAAYGIGTDAYTDDDRMFALMHAMRVRVMTAPSFNSSKILAAILFERTMDGDSMGMPVPTYLWRERGIVPFLKVDRGVEAEANGVRMMKPMPGLDALLERAGKLGIFGTKMRSVINLASPTGIAAVLDQQFALARAIASHGLAPIIEPEVLVASPQKRDAEAILEAELRRRLDLLDGDTEVILKLTIPSVTNQYLPLARHPRVLRLVALSGGYDRAEACRLLARNCEMIASFSRALLDGLNRSMDDATFDAALSVAIEEIFHASTIKEDPPRPAAPAPQTNELSGG